MEVTWDLICGDALARRGFLNPWLGAEVKS